MLGAVTGHNNNTPPAQIEDSEFTLPAGFDIELYADNLGYARFFLITDNNDLIVSITDSGQIILLRDTNNDGTAETKTLLMDGLGAPQGLAFYDQWLYFSERQRISRIRFDHDKGEIVGSTEVIIDNLPYGHPYDSHNTKAIGISPSGKLHLNIGSPCNICEPEDPRYSTMLTSELDGSDLQIHASGLRNSINFDWAPWSGDLYATDNGRDMLGDDFPPDELNLITKGGFYGWPYYHGDNVPDPEYGNKRPDLADSAIKPVFKFRAHNAPLGIHFVEASTLPQEFQKTALVALHGSWNRSTLDGYKVLALHWDNQGNIQSSDFLSGFLTADGIIGRPVDINQDKLGRIYISDDLAGRIYRVSYTDD
jgi:glucose/arabinose dehydrogenase